MPYFDDIGAAVDTVRQLARSRGASPEEIQLEVPEEGREWSLQQFQERLRIAGIDDVALRIRPARGRVRVLSISFRRPA